ncbi:MAG TPA: hypothetical protein PKH93_06315, partial [Chitinophagales bacterium]|nr:hypothetical protein [Chitinophagales bacterium]
TIVVQDTTPPVITCPVGGDTLFRNVITNACFYSVQGTEFDAAATDNCGIVTIQNNINDGNTLAAWDFAPGTYT